MLNQPIESKKPKIKVDKYSVVKKVALNFCTIKFLEYIHRVGRTARAGSNGNALLILRPEELGFLRFLKQAKVPLNEFDFSWSKIADISGQLEKLIEKNYFLNMSAKEAYKSYVRAYASHSMKSVYDVNTLDLKQVAGSFGFRVPPFVDLGVAASRNGNNNKRKMSFQQSDKKAKKAKIYKNVSNKA